MKILFALLAVVGVFFWSISGPNLSQLPAIAQDPIRYFELIDLYRDRTELEELAETGFYTVVDVYSDTCAPCIVLERSFPALTEARPDIIIKRVNGPVAVSKAPPGVPIENLRSNFTDSLWIPADSSDEPNDVHQDIDDFYGKHGYPHIEIFDADGDLVARDTTYSKPATELLNKLIADSQ